MNQHILVITSTFPVSEIDPVPDFVQNQIVAIKKAYPDIEFSVLAPYDAHVRLLPEQNARENEFYKEYRFHYFWPFFLENLTRRGILPTVRQNPLYYVLVPFLFVAEFFALLRCTLKIKPDILYAHWFTPQGINAGLVSMITQIPFVYTSHSSDVAILNKLPFIGPFVARYFSNKARAITVVSRRSLEKVQMFFTALQWNAIKKKIVIIPMGVNFEVGESIQKIEKERKNIVFIGRLVEKKGVQYLLSAFAVVEKMHPNVVLTIAGDGPWRKRLQNQAIDLGVPKEKIIFLGYVHGKEKSKFISDADVFVVPSIIADDGDAEGLPVTLLEGLAAGKICVATCESGADDIMENKVNGFLIPQKDTEALIAALHTTLDLDFENKVRMRDEALKTALKFSWHNLAARYYEILFEEKG